MSQVNKNRSDIFIGPPYHPTYFIIGRKGSGKSALLERAGELYYRRYGYLVCDWASAFDLECLHWCVPDPNQPKDKQVAYPILIIIPRTTEIITDGRMIKTPSGEMVEAVKTVYDDTPLSKIIQQAYDEKRVCIFSIYFYQDPRKGQMKFSHLIRDLPIVMRDNVPGNVNIALLMREIADLASNRMKNYAGTSETESKRGLTQISRMLRHARITGIFDVQNPDDVYGAFIAQEDYILVKRMNKHHIPEKLRWLVQSINEKITFAARHYMLNKVALVSLDRLSNNSFYCVYPDGTFDLQHNHQPSFKHHEVADDAKALAGVQIRFLTKTDLAKDTEVKLIQQKEKQKEKNNKLQAAADAYAKYKAGGTTWDDLAKEFGWLGEDGKPSGQALLMYVQRKIKKGLIPE